MATVKEISHDSSTTLTDHYDSVTDTDTAVTVTAGAALNGSTYGLNVDYDAGSNNVSLIEAFTAISTNEFRFRFRVDTNTLNLGALLTTFLSVYVYHDITADNFAQVQLLGDGAGNIEIDLYYHSDSGGDQNLGPYSLGTGVFCIEARCKRETADTNADGEVELFVDGVSKGSSTSVDNFTSWNANAPNEMQVECLAPGTVTGVMYYDEFILDDSESVQLCGASTAGVYVLGTARDQETDGDTAFVTLWRDDELFLQRWSTNPLSRELEITLGAATLAQVTGSTRIAYPYAGSDQKMWVFGNMVEPAYMTGTVHVAHSTGGGASGTWSIDPDLGSWASTDVLDSLKVSVELDPTGTRQYFAIRHRTDFVPELWQGLNTLSKASDIPFVTGTRVAYRGMDVSNGGGLAVGNAETGTGSHRVLSTLDPWTTWTDITDNFPSGTVEVLRYI